MSKLWLGIVLGIVTAALVIFGVGWAQGTPTAVNATTTASLEPSAAQNVQITLTTAFYSIQTPNSIWQEGSAITYSVAQNSAQGGQSYLAQNQTAALHVVSSSGGVWTMATTVSVNTVALCTSPCSGVTLNLTVTARAIVTTPFAALVGPTCTVVLSSAAAFDTPARTLSPSPSTLYWQLLAPITLALAADLLAAYGAFARHPVLLAAGLIALVALAVEFVLL